MSEDPDVTRSLYDSPPMKSAEMAKVRVRMNVPTMTKRGESWSFFGLCTGTVSQLLDALGSTAGDDRGGGSEGRQLSSR